MYDLKPLALDEIPAHIFSSLSNKNPLEAYFARDYLFVYDNEKTILEMKPQFDQIKQDEKIIVTAKSNGKYDFISRFFCPDININEDPVTGSAHCALTPYWSKALNKNQFKAYQASKRGGEMEIEFKDNRVLMTGNAKTVIEGTFYL